MMIDRRLFVVGVLGGTLAPLSSGAAGNPGNTHDVSIRSFAFEPAMLKVKVGDRIKFTNHDLAPHTATADDGSWDTGTLEQGASVELTVATEWTDSYFCAFHPSMTATLNIEGLDR